MNNSITNSNFRGKLFELPRYSANQYITDLNKHEENRLKGSWLARNFGSPTALYGGLGIILGGELICLAKTKSIKKSNPLKLKEGNTFKNKMLLVLGGTIAGGIAFATAIQSWQNKIIDKKSTKPQEFLEKYGGDTSAKLSDNNLRSTALCAQYNPLNGVIEINKNYIHDPIGRKLVKKYMKHELQHARQFEMIAALDNGLEKVNFASINKVAVSIKKNPIAQAQIKNIIDDINNDKTNLYNNVKIPLSGAKVDFKNYVKAIKIIIDNPDAKPKDIPMVIDVNHYKKAVKKRGPLTENEKLRAEAYYQAALNYPLMTGLNLINPFSGYRSNILEKEARKAGRSKTGKIEYWNVWF